MRPVRALLISYAFPPVGGAGVQRVLKWARYLPDHGVVPTILTVLNPSAPVHDDSLLAEVAPPAKVVRVPTLEPSYRAKAFALDGGGAGSGGPKGRGRVGGSLLRAAGHLLFPDPQVLWLPAAIGALYGFARRTRRMSGASGAGSAAPSQAAERRPFDVALVTAPPFSQFLLVPFIKAALKIPVVLDYRDEWTTTLRAGHDEEAHGWAARFAESLEKHLVVRADAVTTATTEFADALIERVPRLEHRRVHFLPNGYDAADMPDVRAAAPPPGEGKFVLTYAGTVFRLTSLRGLLGALRRLRAKRPDLADAIEVHVYGRIAPSEADAFEGAESLGVRLHGYVGHRAVLAALAKSHMNLCVLDDVPGAERIYPAKIFELMALGRRCLLLAPNGALARLAAAHGMGQAIAPRNEEAIAGALAAALEAWRGGSYDPRIETRGVERYERRALAGELADLLRDLARAEPASVSGAIGASPPAGRAERPWPSSRPGRRAAASSSAPLADGAGQELNGAAARAASGREAR